MEIIKILLQIRKKPIYWGGYSYRISDFRCLQVITFERDKYYLKKKKML